MARPSLLNLETALWVARLGSYSAVARKLNATQPAVSLRIRELELGLGGRLFERHGRQMVPTARGRQFLQRMEPLLDGIQEVLTGFDDPRLETGIVRIGTGNIPMDWTTALIRQLQRQMPRVTYELEIGIAGRLLSQLQEGLLDLVVVAGRQQHASLRCTPVGGTPMHWVMASDRWAVHGEGAGPANLTELLETGPIWLIPRSSAYFAHQTAELKEAGASLHNVSTCDNMHTLIDLVVDGGGIGYLPEVLIAPHLASGRLQRLFPDRAPVVADYTLVHEHTRLQPVVRRIVDIASRQHGFGTAQAVPPSSRR